MCISVHFPLHTHTQLQSHTPSENHCLLVGSWCTGECMFVCLCVCVCVCACEVSSVFCFFMGHLICEFLCLLCGFWCTMQCVMCVCMCVARGPRGCTKSVCMYLSMYILSLICAGCLSLQTTTAPVEQVAPPVADKKPALQPPPVLSSKPALNVRGRGRGRGGGTARPPPTATKPKPEPLEIVPSREEDKSPPARMKVRCCGCRSVCSRLLTVGLLV